MIELMPSTTLATQAYEAIEKMIVTKRIEPGSLISEAFLMDATGLGRTPVREAVQRLASNHLVRIHPNRGVFVPAETVESQLRLLEIRRPLEVLAVRLACQRAGVSERTAIACLTRELDAGGFDIDGYAATIARTHALIADAAHNEFLSSAMAPLQGLSRRFWLTHLRDEEAEIRAGSRLHRDVLQAILDRSARRAEEQSLALNDYLADHARRSIA